MITKEITINVSKKLGQANFSSVMLSASITITVEEETEVSEAYKNGWALCWEEIEKQEKELKDKLDLKEMADAIPVPQQIQSDDPIMDVTAPMCPIHKIAFTWRPAGVSKTSGKPYPGFYACTGRGADGGFCKEKPQK